MKTKNIATLSIRNSLSRSPMRRAFLRPARARLLGAFADRGSRSARQHIHRLLFAATTVTIAIQPWPFAQIALTAPLQAKEQPNEERAIRELNAAVEAGWNKHDASAMDQPFVADCDFVNVFGEWISGHDKLVKTHTALFAGPLRESYKRFTVEKIRFVRPDVAIVTCGDAAPIGRGNFLKGTRAPSLYW